ncbi:MAG: sorbosone dehydrogenase family protein [Phycisphaerales bacterium]
MSPIRPMLGVMFIATAVLAAPRLASAATASTTVNARATPTDAAASPAAAAALRFADDNGAITLPKGFQAVVVHEGVGPARHMAVAADGTIYVALRASVRQDGRTIPRNTSAEARAAMDFGGIAVVRDTNGDGVADTTTYAGREVFGTGIALHDGHLWFGTDDSVVRYAIDPETKLPISPPTVIVSGLVNRRQHAAKPITFDGQGGLYVTVGAPSNACQEQDRAKDSPGMQPCPLLETSAGIWRFDEATPGQTQADGERYATGLRHCVAIAWNTMADDLYVVQHGRDQLNTLYPDTYSVEDNAELPSEELHRVPAGFVGGWPYTYWNHLLGGRVVAPEYGGDGQAMDESGQYAAPIQAFPGHWAPNGLAFYTGEQFPERYRRGTFIAWHGSWNRAPLRQGGYKVTFTPMGADGMPTGDFEVFADGFAGRDPLMNTRDATYRPMGLAVGPDGSMYIASSKQGTIWRVVWTGEGAEVDEAPRDDRGSRLSPPKLSGGRSGS